MSGALLSVVIAIGGFFFFKNFEITGLEGVSFRPRGEHVDDGADQGQGSVTKTSGEQGSGLSGGGTSFSEGSAHRKDSIKIASFNIQVFGTSKSNKPDVMAKLANIVRRFDVVAIQEIRSKNQDIIPQFVNLINATGRKYSFAISERIGRTVSKEQYVYIFDTETLLLDRTKLYTVPDHNDLLHRETFVGWFRTRGPPADKAFTFTLVNIHTDPDETKQELDALADVYRYVKNDGRNEDDVIILGDLNVDEHHLGRLGSIQGMTNAITDVPTNTRGTKQYDNLIFHGMHTDEYLRRFGVFDLKREFNISEAEALRISDHQPVWGEFSIYEGGPDVGIANKPNLPVNR